MFPKVENGLNNKALQTADKVSIPDGLLHEVEPILDHHLDEHDHDVDKSNHELRREDVLDEGRLVTVVETRDGGFDTRNETRGGVVETMRELRAEGVVVPNFGVHFAFCRVAIQMF